MEQNQNLDPNEMKSAASLATHLSEQIARVNPTANTAVDRSVMLNGGNPIQIGFNTTINFRPLNADNYKSAVQQADPKIFPAGLKGLPDNFLQFAQQAEPALFKWLADKKNLAQFTANPVDGFQKFCADNKLQLPDNIKSFLLATQKANAAMKYNMPGVKFKTITSNILQQKK